MVVIALGKFFWSDLHLNHDKDFIYAARGYSNVNEMNTEIISRINETVSSNDDLYLLGDLCLSADIDKNKFLLGQIKCANIHIVVGNHDTNARISMYSSLWNVVDVSYGDRIKIGKYCFMLSHFPMVTTNFDDDKKPRARVYHLYGHTHSKDIFENFSNGGINISVDANEYPVSENEIISFIERWRHEQ